MKCNIVLGLGQNNLRIMVPSPNNDFRAKTYIKVRLHNLPHSRQWVNQRLEMLGPPRQIHGVLLYNFWAMFGKETSMTCVGLQKVTVKSLLQERQAEGARWPRCPWSCSHSHCRTLSCSLNRWSRPVRGLLPHCYYCCYWGEHRKQCLLHCKIS